MTEFIVYNRTDALKTDVHLFSTKTNYQVHRARLLTSFVSLKKNNSEQKIDFRGQTASVTFHGIFDGSRVLNVRSSSRWELGEG